MDNSNYLDCEIVPENDICVEVDNTNVISREYSGVDTEDVDITVNNLDYTISVTIKPTWVEDEEDLPETGSANVIYGIKNEEKLAVWDTANSEYIFFGYILSETDRTKLSTLITMLDNDQFGNVDDVKIDNSSVVDANKIAQFLTINGNYNASTNKLATESDLPTQASDVHALADSTKYGASLGVSGTTVQLKDQDGNNLGSSITTQDTGATSVETTGAGNAVTSASYDSSTRKITLTKGTEFQTATDNSLNTNAKTVSGAINEVNTVAKNANIAKGFTNYQSLITELNSASSTAYKVGQSFYIQTKDVPDLWVISIESESSTYTYVDDATFVTATAVSGGQQVGYYKLGQLETQKVDLSNYVQKTTTIAGVDLQDNISASELRTGLNVADGAQVNTIESVSAGGTALTPDANKNVNIPIAGNSVKGVVDVRAFFGNEVDAYGRLATVKASHQEIDDKTNNYKAIVPSNYTYAVSKTYLKGSGAPTTSTVGFVGQFYLDTTNNNTYQCTAITEDTSTTPSTFTYTWTRMIRATDAAGTTTLGLVKANGNYGIQIGTGGELTAPRPTEQQIAYRTVTPRRLVPVDKINDVVKAALSDNNHLTMDASEQATAQSVLGIQFGITRLG